MLIKPKRLKFPLKLPTTSWHLFNKTKSRPRFEGLDFVLFLFTLFALLLFGNVLKFLFISRLNVLFHFHTKTVKVRIESLTGAFIFSGCAAFPVVSVYDFSILDAFRNKFNPHPFQFFNLCFLTGFVKRNSDPAHLLPASSSDTMDKERKIFRNLHIDHM